MCACDWSESQVMGNCGLPTVGTIDGWTNFSTK
jgi:hypothetical protein